MRSPLELPSTWVYHHSTSIAWYSSLLFCTGRPEHRLRTCPRERRHLPDHPDSRQRWCQRRRGRRHRPRMGWKGRHWTFLRCLVPHRQHQLQLSGEGLFGEGIKLSCLPIIIIAFLLCGLHVMGTMPGYTSIVARSIKRRCVRAAGYLSTSVRR